MDIRPDIGYPKKTIVTKRSAPIPKLKTETHHRMTSDGQDVETIVKEKFYIITDTVEHWYSEEQLIAAKEYRKKQIEDLSVRSIQDEIVENEAKVVELDEAITAGEALNP